MANTISIDPVTRIEGHLAVRVDVSQGKVTDAFCAGEMFRGFEQIMRGRHPMDAQQITQRICGVCPLEHGVASAMAQDVAYGVQPSYNGTLMRNIVQAANFLHSHILHFYVLSAVDFIDVTAILSYGGKDAGMHELRDWVKAQIESKVYLPAAPFLPRYDANYLESKDANLGLLKNYLKALDVRRTCHELAALFAGKVPHMATIVPGGMTQRVDASKIAAAQGFMDTIRPFIEQCYLPDVLAVAKAFPDYWKLGAGVGNFLSYGVFPEAMAQDKKLFCGGTVIEGKFAGLNTGLIREDTAHSWFTDESGNGPFAGETVPSPHKNGAYSWVKAPRYDGLPMEVGSLARMVVGYVSGHEPVKKEVTEFLKATGKGAADLPSVLGRHACRALEAGMLMGAMDEWIVSLKPDAPPATPCTVPSSGEGAGLTEAARGALGHWLQIKKGLVSRYQCIVPTTWNCSPKDAKGVRGPVEQALVGTSIANENAPIEAVRIIRSFDPCLACAVH